MDLSGIGNAIPTFGAPTLEGFEINGAPQDGQRIGGSSNRQFVRFYKKRLAVPYATEVSVNERTGLTTIRKMAVKEVELEMVHIKTPGDTNEYDGEASDYHKRQFWAHYKNYRDGKGVPLGTQLEECSYIPPEVATELRYLGVHTEEQLADASDLLCDQVPNGWDLREFARTNCKVKLDNAASGTINLLKSELAKQQDQIKTLMAQIQQGNLVTPAGDVIPAQEKRSPGRPKKLDLEA